MKHKVYYLPVAQKDLTNIANYISFSLKSPQAAVNLLDELAKAISYLEEFPYMYRVYQTILPLEKEYRIIPIKNYIAFYTVNEQEKIVEIQRIIYAKMDLTQIIE